MVVVQLLDKDGTANDLLGKADRPICRVFTPSTVDQWINLLDSDETSRPLPGEILTIKNISDSDCEISEDSLGAKKITLSASEEITLAVTDLLFVYANCPVGVTLRLTGG